MNEEYSQVRNMIDKSIEREDAYFFSICTLLGIGNIFQKDESYYLGLVVLCLAFFLILKIISCRNNIFYNTTYLIVFIEGNDKNLLYETRFQKMREIFWKDKKGLTKKWVYNIFYRFGYYIKNGIICIFSLILSFQMIVAIFPIDNIKVMFKLVLLLIVTFLNVCYSILLINDRFLTKEFMEKWEQIKKSEKSSLLL